MTGAELKTLREKLGLSVEHLTKKYGVTRKAGFNWESGENKVPPKVEEYLIGLDNKFENYAHEVAREAIKQSKQEPDLIAFVRYKTDEDLWRYQAEFKTLNLPAKCHASLSIRIKDKLAKENIPSKIIYFDENDYLEWLKVRGLEDKTEYRSTWADEKANQL